MIEIKDHLYLQQAFTLAQQRQGFCAPNPSVGAVVVLNNDIIATGYHVAVGHSHAEVVALEKLYNKANNATIYITLEPCCHWGKTPPCTDAIIKAGIKRVVYAYKDPNPIVAGKGEAALLAAGISCDYISLPEIDAFYESYTYWHSTKKPFVTAKIAMTLDGKIAGKQGEPIPITGNTLKDFTHDCRKKSDAILTTCKTITQDDPQFNARFQHEIVSKPLYILDSQLNLPLGATVFTTAKAITVFHAKNAPIYRQQQLSALGVRCYSIDENMYGLNLEHVLEQIGQDGMHDLWVEAGARCFSALMQQKLLHRAFIYMAPWIAGVGNSAFNEKIDFRTHSIHWRQLGNDVLCEIHC